MNALEPLYHNYELAHFETPGGAEHLQFIYKETVDGKLTTILDGTTNEEVLAVLIHRLKGLYQKLPSIQTESAIWFCEKALFALNDRTARRKARGVEGTHNP